MWHIAVICASNVLFACFRCYARLHPRAVNCRKKKCGHSNQVLLLDTILNLVFVCLINSCTHLFCWHVIAVEAKEEDQVDMISSFYQLVAAGGFIYCS